MGYSVKNADLLPCPFCGEIPKLCEWDEDCRYECMKCGCALCWENSEHEAFEKWNRRAYYPARDVRDNDRSSSGGES